VYPNQAIPLRDKKTLFISEGVKNDSKINCNFYQGFLQIYITLDIVQLFKSKYKVAKNSFSSKILTHKHKILPFNLENAP